MSLLAASKIAKLEKNCNHILEHDDVKFVGVINKLGNLVVGGFNKKMKPVGTEQTWKMMYMQLKLDIEMRKDYDELFGPVSYVVSKRRGRREGIHTYWILHGFVDHQTEF